VRRRQRSGGPHLLEVGLRWPPETFLGWKLEGMAKRGMRVTVASWSVVDPDARVPGVRLVRVRKRDRTRLRDRWAVRLDIAVIALHSPRRLARLRRAVREATPGVLHRYEGRWGLLSFLATLGRLRPDVVHFEWNTTAVTHMPMFAVWDRPVVVSCHGSQLTATPRSPDMAEYAQGLPELMRRASVVHCVSDSLRAEVLDLGADPSRARVIRQGIDPEVFRPNGRAPDPAELRVLAIGWMTWVKGYEFALLAIRRLVDRGVPVRYEILGDAAGGPGGEMARVRHTVADLGLEDHVELPGAVPSAEVVRRLGECDVLLHASLEEGLPTVLLEAMASGVPVVATDCGGVTEAVTDGVEGFVVTPRDPEGLADALAALWESPQLRARMGQAGRATATGRFTLQRQLEEFADLYREVAGA
jgi:colanic acid/amylovoran/stewartan biosynthesis glycosyltransferase WcaL/AmsK/CpsK